MTQRAHAAGARADQIPSARYTHLIYRNQADLGAGDAPLTLVFIEGDGSPWSADGTRPARDPTPTHPLAFNLLLKTTLPAWYLTRPCYNEIQLDAKCKSLMWTDNRYAEDVVESMAQALVVKIKRLQRRKIVLIGYSGGGTLAVLMAARLPQVVGVITIAANLDTLAWSRVHDYEPLSGSLNPTVDVAPLKVRHIALIGDQDKNVTFDSLSGFLQSQPDTMVEHFPSYDHVCCWEENWQNILADALKRIAQ